MPTGTGPNLATVIHNAAILTPTTQDTSLVAPTHVSTVFTAGTNGSRVDLIRINQVLTTAAAGCVNLFLFDGTTYWLLDVYAYGVATVTPGSGIELNPVDLIYNTLEMMTGWSLRVTDSGTAGASAHFCVQAFGGDF